MAPYPPFKPPVKRTESTSSFPPVRDRRPPSLTGESDPERIARLERSEEFLQVQIKTLSRRIEAVEKSEDASNVRELLRESEAALAKAAREKAAADEQKKDDARAAAELARALAKEAAWRAFKYGLLASLVMFGLGLLTAHLLR